MLGRVLEAEGSACILAQREERAYDADGTEGKVGGPGESDERCEIGACAEPDLWTSLILRIPFS